MFVVVGWVYEVLLWCFFVGVLVVFWGFFLVVVWEVFFFFFVDVFVVFFVVFFGEVFVFGVLFVVVFLLCDVCVFLIDCCSVVSRLMILLLFLDFFFCGGVGGVCVFLDDIFVVMSCFSVVMYVFLYCDGLKFLVSDFMSDDVIVSFCGCIVMLLLRMGKFVLCILLGYSSVCSMMILFCICSIVIDLCCWIVILMIVIWFVFFSVLCSSVYGLVVVLLGFR